MYFVAHSMLSPQVGQNWIVASEAPTRSVHHRCGAIRRWAFLRGVSVNVLCSSSSSCKMVQRIAFAFASFTSTPSLQPHKSLLHCLVTFHTLMHSLTNTTTFRPLSGYHAIPIHFHGATLALGDQDLKARILSLPSRDPAKKSILAPSLQSSFLWHYAALLLYTSPHHTCQIINPHTPILR